MNKVELIGRTTKDIELRYTKTNKAVASFTLAVNRRSEGADFIPCEAWEKKAETLEKYVKKGDMVGLAGHLNVSTYEKDGQKKTSVKVIIDDFDFLPNKRAEQSSKGFEPVDDNLPY